MRSREGKRGRVYGIISDRWCGYLCLQRVGGWVSGARGGGRASLAKAGARRRVFCFEVGGVRMGSLLVYSRSCSFCPADAHFIFLLSCMDACIAVSLYCCILHGSVVLKDPKVTPHNCVT